MSARILPSAAIAACLALIHAGSARADFRVTDTITAINGTAITGSTYTDPYGNVLNLNSSSATGLALTPAQAGFTIQSTAFAPGEDRVISQIVVTNLNTGDSLTFVSSVGYIFGFTPPYNNRIGIDLDFSLTLNGSTSFGTQNLGGVTFVISDYQVHTSAGGRSGLGTSIVSVQITPEPSSFALCGIAGGLGLMVARIRRAGRRVSSSA